MVKCTCWLTCRPLFAIAACLLVFESIVSAAGLPSVTTPMRPVTNYYDGVAVIDNYQWLEQSGTPPVKDWTREQNDRTSAYFARLPYREGIAQELTQLRSEESARYGGFQCRRDRIFALRFKPPQQQPVLIRLFSLEPPALWKTVFDPNNYNTNGTTAIDWYIPSVDGRLVAISLSQGGSEEGTLHFFEADTGKELSDTIPRVQYPTGGGSAAWTSDGTAIFYTRYPHEGERPAADLNFYQQVWVHRLGTPATEDHYVIGKEFPRIAEIALDSSGDGRWTLAGVENGDGGDFAHYLRNPNGGWQQFTHFEDGIKAVRFGRDNDLYLLSLKGAPRGKVQLSAGSDRPPRLRAWHASA